MRAALSKSQAQLTTPILAPYWLCAHMMKTYFWEFYGVLGD